MTVKEAEAIYPVHEYTTSTGDNITRIVRMLYGEDFNNAYATLKELNQRYDWSYLEGGETIKYFPTDILNLIDVFYSTR